MTRIQTTATRHHPCDASPLLLRRAQARLTLAHLQRLFGYRSCSQPGKCFNSSRITLPPPKGGREGGTRGPKNGPSQVACMSPNRDSVNGRQHRLASCSLMCSSGPDGVLSTQSPSSPSRFSLLASRAKLMARHVSDYYHHPRCHATIDIMTPYSRFDSKTTCPRLCSPASPQP